MQQNLIFDIFFHFLSNVQKSKIKLSNANYSINCTRSGFTPWRTSIVWLHLTPLEYFAVSYIIPTSPNVKGWCFLKNSYDLRLHERTTLSLKSKMPDGFRWCTYDESKTRRTTLQNRFTDFTGCKRFYCKVHCISAVLTFNLFLLPHRKS